MAYIRRRGCKCPKDTKRCTCGAKWSFTVDIGIDPVTGKRKQYTKSGFDSRRDAELAAAKVEAEVASGTFVKESNITFREFAESWIKFYESTGLVKPGSVLVRKTRINNLLKYFGALRMRDITRMNYQNMLIDLKQKGLADETIVSTHATAKLIFRRALELDLIKSDPTLYAKVPKTLKTVEEIEQGTKLPKYMEKEELAHFLDIARRFGVDKDYAVFMTLAYTGIRIGELCALKWKDIDFENLTIRITKTIHNPGNNTRNYKLVPPKTEASIRTIDIDKNLASVLEKHRSLVNAIKMRYRDRYHDQDFVFPNLNERYPGYPEVQKNIEARMKRLLKIAGMNLEFTPHSLRHTHTTLLAEAGAGLQEIMERLGHKDDETTKNVYLHITKSMKRGAAQKFSDLMQKVVKS